MTSSTSYDLKYGKEQFYALALDKLAEVSSILSSNAAEEIHVENGYVSIEVEAVENEMLYVSVPYDSGWTITRNGQEISPELFADCMYSIPLEPGTNSIEMTYSVRGLFPGIIITFVGVALLILTWFIEQKARRNKKGCCSL